MSTQKFITAPIELHSVKGSLLDSGSCVIAVRARQCPLAVIERVSKIKQHLEQSLGHVLYSGAARFSFTGKFMIFNFSVELYLYRYRFYETGPALVTRNL